MPYDHLTPHSPLSPSLPPSPLSFFSCVCLSPFLLPSSSSVGHCVCIPSPSLPSSVGHCCGSSLVLSCCFPILSCGSHVFPLLSGSPYVPPSPLILSLPPNFPSSLILECLPSSLPLVPVRIPPHLLVPLWPLSSSATFVMRYPSFSTLPSPPFFPLACLNPPVDR